jgi:multidrug efflux pump subunit AcrA (membrane-fusion protein)
MTRHLLSLLLAGCNAAALVTPNAPDVRPPSAQATWVPLRDAGEARLLEASARIVPAPGASAALTPPLTARLLHFHVRMGDHVAAGARIATVLMPEAVAAAGRLLAARTRLTAVGERQRGIEALAKEGFSRLADRIEVQSQMADANAEEQVAKATLAAAGISPQQAERLILDEGRVDLRAPFAGIVIELDGDIGEQRPAGGKPFARIIDTARLVIEASFTQVIEAGTPATFIDGRGNETAVVWASKSLVADPSTGVFRAHFVVPANADWQPGTFGRVQLRPQQKWFLVPSAALTSGSELVLESGARVKVEVISRSAAEAIIAVSTLKVGDKVSAAPHGSTP